MTAIQPIILAGGKGTRMKSEGPKVLVLLRGIPMIRHLLNAVQNAHPSATPLIVIGHAGETVKEALGANFQYVKQEQQLGTGHAVATALPHTIGTCDHVLVLYGDHPLVSSETIQAITQSHIQNKNALTMATVSLTDFLGDNSCFLDYGRIIRNSKGDIIDSVETKDATPEQRLITEVNPCYYCFDARWLEENIKKLNSGNAQKEYYLTDLVRIARAHGSKIGGVSIPPRDAMGANTPEQLATLDKLLET